MAALSAPAQIGPPPIVLTPPLNLSLRLGKKAQFVVLVAPSITTLSYQWRLNGTNIAGAKGTTHSLAISCTINKIQASDVGNYSVCISNASGWVVSMPAALSIESEKVKLLSPKKDNSGFKFNLSGPGDSTYVIMCSTNMVNWFPISTNFSSSGALSYTDSRGTNAGTRLYKVVLLPVDN